MENLRKKTIILYLNKRFQGGSFTNLDLYRLGFSISDVKGLRKYGIIEPSIDALGLERYKVVDE